MLGVFVGVTIPLAAMVSAAVLQPGPPAANHQSPATSPQFDMEGLKVPIEFWIPFPGVGKEEAIILTNTLIVVGVVLLLRFWRPGA